MGVKSSFSEFIRTSSLRQTSWSFTSLLILRIRESNLPIPGLERDIEGYHLSVRPLGGKVIKAGILGGGKTETMVRSPSDESVA